MLCGAQAVELTLGLSEADLAEGDDASFAQLGGDSLAAIQFARSIDELCGVPLPVSFVLDHSNSLAGITAKARARRGRDAQRRRARGAGPCCAGSAQLCGRAPM
jgi:fatty acid CoA ligase FadD9